MRIAINGMGRIGRLLCKLLAQGNHTIVAVNDIMTQDNLIYLLRYDTIYGTYFANTITVKSRPDGFAINGKIVKVLNEASPERLPWKDLDIDLVIECTGRYLNRQTLEPHLGAGAKKVLLSTTGSVDIPLVIRGFNEKDLLKSERLLSSGGCMTNCTTLVLDNLIGKFGLESVHINVVHSYTSRQSLVDGPHKDVRRGRASATSIIPVDSDLAATLELLFPALKGKVSSVTTRVPVECGALVDFHVVTKNLADEKEINKSFETLAYGPLKNLLSVNHDPVVSRDILANHHSAIVDTTLTRVIGNHVKLGAWFDDQFGFTNRLVEIIDLLEKI